MNVQTPIGIFDSGLGGLSVAREIRRRLPGESLRYVADSRFCPYGSRSVDEIRWRSLMVADALVEAGAKLLVVACNTATAVALEALRARHSVPIVGLEPAVKPAVALSRAKRIGVLATSRTASSERLRLLVERYAGDAAVVHTVPAPGLVELVEGGDTDGAAARETVRGLVQPLLDGGVDTIVLGCTHYPFLRGVVEEIAGPHVCLVDSGAAIARRTDELLALFGGHATGPHGDVRLATTGDPAVVAPVARRLWGEPLAVERLSLPDQEPASAKPAPVWTSSVSASA